MTFIRLAAIVTAVLISLTGCQPTASPEQQLLDNIANHVILPAQQQFSQHSSELARLSESFCGQPDSAGLEQLREQWRQSMRTWQAVKVIGFGPISVDNQSWKIQFWPDKHNLIEKKLNNLLRSDEELTVERIGKASVVTQGLSALEFLLFDHQDGQLGSYQTGPLSPRRCQLLQAVSQHTEQVAANLYRAWRADAGNYRARLTATGPDNSDFPDQASAIAALVDALVNSVEVAKRDQLAQPLGHRAKGNRPRPYLSEAWRSRYSSQALAANLYAAANLYRGADGYGMDDYLKHRGEAELAVKIDNLFSRATGQLELLPNIFDGVSDPDQHKLLQQLYVDVGLLQTQLKTQLPAAMGVNLGFNANDGD